MTNILFPNLQTDSNTHRLGGTASHRNMKMHNAHVGEHAAPFMHTHPNTHKHEVYSHLRKKKKFFSFWSNRELIDLTERRTNQIIPYTSLCQSIIGAVCKPVRANAPSVLLHLQCVNMSTPVKASLLMASIYITELPNDAKEHLRLQPPLSSHGRLPCLFWSVSVWSYTMQLCLCPTLSVIFTSCINNLPCSGLSPPFGYNLLVSLLKA